MKKLFIIACLIFAVFTFNFAAQAQQGKRKISEMIAASQRIGNLLSGLPGGTSADSGNAEITSLSAVTFPGAVRVTFLDETQKISKTRKKAIDKWLKEYGKKPDAKKFYVNEIAVEEDGTRYWIMSHEANVIERLKNFAKKNDEITLNLQIIGYYKKGQTTDYFLIAESVQ